MRARTGSKGEVVQSPPQQRPGSKPGRARRERGLPRSASPGDGAAAPSALPYAEWYHADCSSAPLHSVKWRGKIDSDNLSGQDPARWGTCTPSGRGAQQQLALAATPAAVLSARWRLEAKWERTFRFAYRGYAARQGGVKVPRYK